MAELSRVALVTGGGRGIGRAIVMALAERGWSIVFNYLGNAAAADETLQSIREAGAEGFAVRANVAVHDDRKALLATALTKFQRLDLLVNNAGMAPRVRHDLLLVTETSFDEVMAVNLRGPFFLSQLVATEMIAQLEHGSIIAPKIINIGSISAFTSSPNRAEYCLSKAGMSMMTALFAHRLAEHGILVYEIRPGIIATDMTSAVKEKYDDMFAAGLTPIARWGTPADVAKAVISVAEGSLPYSTGEVINVDGGFHLQRL